MSQHNHASGVEKIMILFIAHIMPTLRLLEIIKTFCEITTIILWASRGKSDWEEALVQLVMISDRYQKSTTTSIQVLVDQVSEIATMLANKLQESSPSNIEKESKE